MRLLSPSHNFSMLTPFSQMRPAKTPTAIKSECVIPLIDKENGSEIIIGVINIESLEIGRFDRYKNSESVNILKALATQTTVAIKNARRHEDVIAMLNLSSNLLASITTNQDLNDIANAYEFIMTRLMKSVGAKHGQLLFDRGNYLEIRWSTKADDKGIRVKKEQSVIGKAIKQKKFIILPDVALESLYINTLGNMKSELALPLFSGEKVICVINLESDRLDAFHESDIYTLKLLTSSGMLIERLKELEGQHEDFKSKEALEKMALMGDISGNLSHQLNNKLPIINIWIDEIRRDCAEEIVRNKILSDRLNDIKQNVLEAVEIPKQYKERAERAERTENVDINHLIQG